ncbi:leucyl/phenylalanyl-tRNA--protein transferase [Methyloligella halotolerans]|nr:leucyl/phenylalanyl-tRNA--protein transferase [Methyloligella halotolerans]
MPGLTKLWLKDQVGLLPRIPDPRSEEQAGIVVGVARDLSVTTLVAAAKRGIYPLGHVGAPKWCSPKTRAVLFFDDFHISKSARRSMRKGQYRVTFDQAFEEVIVACSEPRPGHWHVNWITPAMKHAYARLFDAGFAHSIEVWDHEGNLKGGGYGVAIGRVFIGESLFSHARDTSKIAVAVLMRHLVEWGYSFVDTKLMNPLMESFGFQEIPRDRFLSMNEKAMNAQGWVGRWEVEIGPEEVATCTRIEKRQRQKRRPPESLVGAYDGVWRSSRHAGPDGPPGSRPGRCRLARPGSQLGACRRARRAVRRSRRLYAAFRLRQGLLSPLQLRTPEMVGAGRADGAVPGAVPARQPDRPEAL